MKKTNSRNAKAGLVRRCASLFLLAVSLAVVPVFSGCPRAFVERVTPVDGADFTDNAMATVFADLFGKKLGQVTEEDLATVECFEIMTYSGTNVIRIAQSGYLDYIAQEDYDYAAAAEYVLEADITNKTFSTYNDLRYLTGLREFSDVYAALDSYDFLKYCKKLESFSLMANYECDDFAFLSELPNLEKVSISECAVADLSQFSGLSSLKELMLEQVSVGDYMLSDLSFLSGLTNLESLSLSSNMIYDVTPLESLTNLAYLNLSYNGIEDVSPIAGLTSLRYIDLTQNLISDLSPLTQYDPESFERIILDLNSGIKDWSPLNYLGAAVQGKPIEISSPIFAALYGSETGSIVRDELSSIEAVTLENRDGVIYVLAGFDGYLDAAEEEKDSLLKTVSLDDVDEDLDTFFGYFRYLSGLRSFALHGVSVESFDFLDRCSGLERFEVTGNDASADYTALSELPSLSDISVTDSTLSSEARDLLSGLGAVLSDG